MVKFKAVLNIALAALFACGASQAVAQAYPNRPVRLVVTFDPGAAADALGRGIGEQLSTRLGQPVIIENKMGAGGNIGTDYVAKSKPDGYTILLVSTGPMAIHQSLYKSLPFNPEKDFVPITLAAISPNIFVANPSVGAKNVAELVKLAKTVPGQMNYSSAGIGTTQHLAGEMLNTMAQINIVHVPYKGGTFAMQDLLGNRIQLAFVTVAGLQFVKQGRLTPLGVTGSQRMPALPDVPTMAEQGLTGYDATAWFGIVAPAGTPKEIVARLNTEITAILRQPDLKEKMLQQGMELSPTSPEQFASFINLERAKWSRVVKTSGAVVD